jgi:lycopene cyclase domain-containing protein
LLSGIVASGAVAALDLALGTQLLRQRRFWIYLGVMLVCQFVFNGYLTARPVTLYDPCCHLGPRIITMPVEDTLFGTALLGLVVVLWEWGGRLLAPTPRAALADGDNDDGPV